MSGLQVHHHGNLLGWHSIETPPLSRHSMDCPCCYHKLQPVYDVTNNENAIEVVCCDHCGYVGYGQLPEARWLDDYYRGDWMQGEDITPETNHPMAEILAQVVPKHGSILEIGCGKGDCLASLRKKGYRHLAGVEQCQHRARSSSLHTGLTITADWPEGYWDVIASFHVLEHFHNPHVFFEQASQRQRDNGCLLLVVPKADWEPILGQLLFILHLHSFTSSALELMAGQHGYKKLVDATNATDVIQLYSKSDVSLKSIELGGYVNKMEQKLNHGLCLSQTVERKNLSWRIFDTYATLNTIPEAHRSLCVSSINDRGLHFDDDNFLFVK